MPRCRVIDWRSREVGEVLQLIGTIIVIIIMTHCPFCCHLLWWVNSINHYHYFGIQNTSSQRSNRTIDTAVNYPILCIQQMPCKGSCFYWLLGYLLRLPHPMISNNSNIVVGWQLEQVRRSIILSRPLSRGLLLRMHKSNQTRRKVVAPAVTSWFQSFTTAVICYQDHSTFNLRSTNKEIKSIFTWTIRLLNLHTTKTKEIGWSDQLGQPFHVNHLLSHLIMEGAAPSRVRSTFVKARNTSLG
jgi:hypothetical protein